MRDAFKEAVREAVRGEGLSPESVQKAAGSVLQGLPSSTDCFSDTHVEEAARRARKLEDWEDFPESGGEQGPTLEEPIAPPGPSTEVLSRRRRTAAEPYVRDLRNELFGDPDPPFGGLDDPAFAQWDVEGFWADSDERASLYDAVERLARGSGFRESDVRNWILFGETPSLPARMILRVSDKKEPLSSDVTLRRREVVLVLHAPVQESEIRRWWRRIQEVWKAPVGRALERTRVTSPTELDEHLERILQVMPEGATWAEVRDRWCETPPDGWSAEAWTHSEHVQGRKGGRITPDALRIRKSRIDDKVDALT